ncbi:Gfo/Idh/MocA family protein [Haloarcula marina]|uniref:Gfo/Idh/MocA family protein n=1 Tax=Haloarcula marina TaxID=2961574 RepID=UPI0020B8FB07|nr:Gfo/Idh/MocA family oxidoreductase [Halomicroarcula marina]
MTYRIAIAGIGAVADIHAAAISDLADATLVAGSCRTGEKGRTFASEHDCEWYEDTETMLDESAPDVLLVCTPSGAHLEPTVAAAERGVHILCEKPLEITTERIDAMRDAADRAGVRLGGVFQQRYNPVVQQVRDAASEGRFGDLSVVSTSVPWWRDDDYYGPDRWQGRRMLDGGGAMMNQSIHGIDAIQWLASAAMPGLDPGVNPVEEVFAFTATRAHDTDRVEVEDTAVAVLRYRNGALGHVLGTTSMYPGSLKRIRMAGRDGTAELLEDELVTWQFREAADDDTAIRNRFGGESDGGGAADPMSIEDEFHRRNIDSFLTAVERDEPYMLDAQEARKAVEIVEAVYESAERGRPIEIGD